MSAPRGRRAGFPEAPADASGESDTLAALRFSVPLPDGEAVGVNMTAWSRPRLTRSFAAAFRDDLTAPGTICTKPMVKRRLNELRRFWHFLDDTGETVETLEAVTPELIDRYEAWLARHGGRSIYQRQLLARPIALLRLIDEREPERLSPALIERLSYLSLRPYEPSQPRDAYSPGVAEALRQAARRQVLDTATRIAPEGVLPEPPDGLHPAVLEQYLAVLEEIDRRGWLPQRREPLANRLIQRAACWGTPIGRWEDLHARFHLRADDVIAFLVLLSLETGLEIEACTRLKAGCLRNPTKGSVEIEYLKRRARGAEWKRLRVRDGGPTTPGGLIRLARRLTARARRHAGGEALWVYCCHAGLIAGMKYHSIPAQYFVRRHALVDDDGAVLHLQLARLRKTQKAEWYLKTNGQLDAFAVGHSLEVAANHYADIPALRHVHEQTVAEALQDAADAALEPHVVTPDAEQAIRAEPAHADLPVPAGEVVAFLDGAQDVWLASCSGFYDSPFGRKGEACPVAFWGCLECPNAVITSRKLPALIAFLDFMTGQRESLTAGDWAVKFARAYRRIAEQILPAFPEPVVAAARSIAADRSDLLHLPPEAGAR